MVPRPPFTDILRFRGRKHALIIAPEAEERHMKNIAKAATAFRLTRYASVHQFIPGTVDIAERFGGTYRHHEPARNTIAGIEECIRGIQQSYDPSADALTLYVTGHGGIRGGYGALRFDDGVLEARKLAGLVKGTLNDPSLLIIADQCFGADFAEPFITAPHTIGVAASARGCPSYRESFPGAFFPILECQGQVRRSFHLACLEDWNAGLQRPQYLAFAEGRLRMDPGPMPPAAPCGYAAAPRSTARRAA